MSELPQYKRDKIFEAHKLGMTIRKAAKYSETCEATVRYWWKKVGLESPLARPAYPQDVLDKIYQAHAQGMSLGEAAKYAGTSDGTVKYHWKDAGLKAHNKVSPNNYWTPEKIDDEFNASCKTLGRAPTATEFINLCGRAHSAILRGRYGNGIETYAAYLEAKGFAPPRQKLKPEEIDAYFGKLMAKLGRVPTSTEFEKESSRAMGAITSGKYDPNIKGYKDYVKARGFEPISKNRSPGYWKKQTVDAAFDEQTSELKRTPTSKEFGKKHKGALAAITDGRYSDDIRNYTDYLNARETSGKKYLPPGFWTPDKSQQAFNIMYERFGRVPTREELDRAYPGASQHIDRKEFPAARHNQQPKGYWTNEKVDEAFFGLKEKRGRVPFMTEFRKVHGGAVTFIESGRYADNIKNYDDYLKSKGLEIDFKRTPHRYWRSPENIDNAFDDQMTRLGRIPTSIEFGKAAKGALAAIADGGYKKDVRCYTDYLRHRGLQPNQNIYRRGHWTRDKIDAAHDEHTTRLGRVPTWKEFEKEYHGAITVILNGEYATSVKTYTDYLRFRGLLEVNSVRALSQLLDTETGARYAIQLARGDDVDLADILSVVYEGKLAKDDVMDFLNDPSLREYLGKFKMRGGISDITEPAQRLLKLDKGGVIAEILKRRLREHRKQTLGTSPTRMQINAYMQELEEELDKMGVMI